MKGIYTYIPEEEEWIEDRDETTNQVVDETTNEVIDEIEADLPTAPYLPPSPLVIRGTPWWHIAFMSLPYLVVASLLIAFVLLTLDVRNGWVPVKDFHQANKGAK